MHGESYAGAPSAAPLPQRGNVRGPNSAGSRGDVTRGFRAGRRSSSKASSARRCRRTAVSRRTRSWPTGGPTASRSTCRRNTRPAFAASSRMRSACRSAASASSSTRWAADSAPSRAPATTCARRWPCRGRRSAPVRLVLDRKEEQLDSGNRPATVQRLRIGATPRRHPHRDLARYLRHGRRRPGRRRRQHRPVDVRLRELRHRPVRRLHQRRARMRDARAGQRAGRVRARADDRRTRREARHGSARAARPHRSEPGAPRGAAPRRRALRLEPAACARLRFRPGQARDRDGAILLGRERAHQRIVRGAHPARRLGRAPLRRAGHRHRHRHRARPGRRRGTGPASRGHRRSASATRTSPPGRRRTAA